MKYFWLTTVLVILEIKISLVSIKKFLHQYHPVFTRHVSSHRVLHLWSLGSYNVYAIYLHVIGACLKVIIAMLYFCHSKNSSNIIKNIFNSISTYSWKKVPSSANIRNNVIRKIRYICKNLSNFDYIDSICFGIFHVA